jgi:hypothetical protein
MKTFLWIFWPLAKGIPWSDRLRMAFYAAIIFIPLALLFWAWLWAGPSLSRLLGKI